MSKNAPYTPCLDPDCDEFAVTNGRCNRHYIPFKGSTRRSRLPKDWRSRREAVMYRDKGICYICGGPGADTVDHVEPGDDHRMSNLKAVHDAMPPHCHRTKTAYEGLHMSPPGEKPF